MLKKQSHAREWVERISYHMIANCFASIAMQLAILVRYCRHHRRSFLRVAGIGYAGGVHVIHVAGDVLGEERNFVRLQMTGTNAQ
jgi:hypothetical protein